MHEATSEVIVVLIKLQSKQQIFLEAFPSLALSNFLFQCFPWGWEGAERKDIVKEMEDKS